MSRPKRRNLVDVPGSSLEVCLLSNGRYSVMLTASGAALTVPIENPELHENMKLAHPLSFRLALSTLHWLTFATVTTFTSGALQVENLALRHQLAVLGRSAKRPKLTSADRLWWVGYTKLGAIGDPGWPGWSMLFTMMLAFLVAEESG